MTWDAEFSASLFFWEITLSRYSEATLALEAAFAGAIPKAKKNKAPTQAEWTLALGKFNAEARSIRTRFHLGVIGRAMVAYRLQPRLLASGYSPDVVRQLLFSMILSAFIG